MRPIKQHSMLHPFHGHPHEASASLLQVQRLSRLLDSSIPLPGTKFRIGLDPILGLVPGIGDVVASVMSAYIVLLAVEAGASSWTLARMVGNVALESVLGTIPLVGDVFDAVWKANERNHRLLAANLNRPAATKADRKVVILSIIALVLCLVVVVWLAAFVIRTILGLMG